MNSVNPVNSSGTDLLRPQAWQDPALARRLLARIAAVCQQAGWGLPDSGGRQLVIMEICGTHTMAIARWGLRSLLPPGLRLMSGPGCPVCVTSDAQVDQMIALAHAPVTVATYGDLLRVPGSRGQTLAQARAAGADVRVVYSPLDALELARQLQPRPVVLLGVGFETTAPAVALALQQAKVGHVRNFLLYSAHKLTPPAMRALVTSGEQRIDAFLIPGHVSAVLGERAFAFLAEELGCGAVVAGFEPIDILAAVLWIATEAATAGTAAAGPVATVAAGAAGDASAARPASRVHNAYRRAVRPEGNPAAQALMDQVFTPVTTDWRGLGRIPASGLALRPEWQAWDAGVQLGLADLPARPATPPQADAGHADAPLADSSGRRTDPGEAHPHAGCRCGEVLRGLIEPNNCPLFGRACTPLHPRGPCMVSSEGACAAYYRYAQDTLPA